jgi:hypothetical protein
MNDDLDHAFCQVGATKEMDVPGVDRTIVTVVPWYERKDYDKIRCMRDGARLPGSYEAWLENAFRDMRQLLARGCALKIVTIHLDEYFAWLSREGRPDSDAARSRYITELGRAGTQLANASTSGEGTSLNWPTMH